MSEQSTPARPDEQVEYRLVQGYPAYRVGRDGSLWTRWKQAGMGPGGVKLRPVLSDVWRRMRPSPVRSGHLSVRLGDGRNQVSRKVHRLVLEAFVGPRPPGMHCRHLDGDPTNNRLDNLCWGTPKENSADAIRHGVLARGARHGFAKLTEAVVADIKRRLARGETQRSVARLHNVSQPNVCLIASGGTWRHVTI